MIRLLQYYGRVQGVRGTLGRLPAWGRLILLIAALPGFVLLALSILAFGVSLLALLLLTAPVYRLLLALTGGGRGSQGMPETPVSGSDVPPMSPSPGRRHIDVTIVE